MKKTMILLLAAVLLVVGGGGYAGYMYTQNKKKAAQRAAERRAKAARQKTETAGNTPTAPKTADKANGSVNAQDAAKASRVRTGTYTNTKGSAVPNAVPSDRTASGKEKKYGNTMNNPYGRYSSPKTGETGSENYEDTFKPEKPANAQTSSKPVKADAPQRTKRTNSGTNGPDDDEI